MKANNLKEMIYKRTGINSNELDCPRQKTFMTPCIARDGDIATTDDNMKCIGCLNDVDELLKDEKNKS